VNGRPLIWAAVISAALALGGAALAVALGSRSAAVIIAVVGLAIAGGCLRGWGQIKRSSE
jgi:hypothetical protein